MIKKQDSICPLCANTGMYDFTGQDLMFKTPGNYEYHTCNSCDALYQVPIPSLDEISGFYPDVYKVYDEEIKLKPRGPLERAILNTHYGYSHIPASFFLKIISPLFSIYRERNTLAYENGGNMLDIGCANGRFLLRMQELGWKVQGVEFNETAVNICRKNKLNVYHGDLESANIESDSLDLVTARHVIEHVPDPHTFIAEIARILKTGGRMHLRTPNSKSLGRYLFGHFWYANDVPRHLIMFSKKNLDMLAAKHGLVPVDVRTNVRAKLVLNSLDYKIGNTGKPSRKRKLRRLISKLYIPIAKLLNRGDEIFAIYRKP